MSREVIKSILEKMEKRDIEKIEKLDAEKVEQGVNVVKIIDTELSKTVRVKDMKGQVYLLDLSIKDRERIQDYIIRMRMRVKVMGLVLKLGVKKVKGSTKKEIVIKRVI